MSVLVNRLGGHAAYSLFAGLVSKICLHIHPGLVLHPFVLCVFGLNVSCKFTPPLNLHPLNLHGLKQMTSTASLFLY